MYALLEDPKYLVCQALSERPHVSMKELCTQLYVPAREVSDVLGQLERQGLVRRTAADAYSLVESRKAGLERMLEEMRVPHRPTNAAFGEIRGIIVLAAEQFFAAAAALDAEQLRALHELIDTARTSEGPDLRYDVESYYVALTDVVTILEYKDIVLAFGKLRQAHRMFSVVDPQFASFIKFIITGLEIVIISVYGEGGERVTHTAD